MGGITNPDLNQLKRSAETLRVHSIYFSVCRLLTRPISNRQTLRGEVLLAAHSGGGAVKRCVGSAPCWKLTWGHPGVGGGVRGVCLLPVEVVIFWLQEAAVLVGARETRCRRPHWTPWERERERERLVNIEVLLRKHHRKPVGQICKLFHHYFKANLRLHVFCNIGFKLHY